MLKNLVLETRTRYLYKHASFLCKTEARFYLVQETCNRKILCEKARHTHKKLHGMVPRYLQDVIQPDAEVTSRRRLRFASSSALVVPATRRSSLGDRTFAIAGPRAWNSLPEFITDCSSPFTFNKYLKTYLFSLSFIS